MLTGMWILVYWAVHTDFQNEVAIADHFVTTNRAACLRNKKLIEDQLERDGFQMRTVICMPDLVKNKHG